MVKKREIIEAVHSDLLDVRDHILAIEETQRFILAAIPNKDLFKTAEENWPGILRMAQYEAHADWLSEQFDAPIFAEHVRDRFRAIRESAVEKGRTLDVDRNDSNILLEALRQSYPLPTDDELIDDK